MDDESRTWAWEEFGQAALGDERRRWRLVDIAAGAAATPAGKITEVFRDSAAREGAFRFVNNPHVSAEALGRASHEACVRRCAEHPYVLVPVDGSSLTVTDWRKGKDFGSVGKRSKRGRGVHVQNAIAVSPDGTSLGVCGQRWWKRGAKPSPKDKQDKRPLRERESHHWPAMMNAIADLFAAQAPACTPWFQLDRGGDSWPVLALAQERRLSVTVRSCYDRRLQDQGGKRRYLRSTLKAQPVLGRYEVAVPARTGRPARTATVSVRATTVTVQLAVTRKRKLQVELQAVWVREVGSVPRGQQRLDWMLLTTHPVDGFEDACEVIAAYAQRWRIEDFHRAWKRGACRVEESQLHSFEALVRWATILAAVAIRAERLKHRARSEPHLPATTELSQDEIDATLVLKKKTKYRRGDVPTLGEVVRWIADLGGYTGQSSGGPPGATVISRGLLRVSAAAEALKNLRESGM